MTAPPSRMTSFLLLRPTFAILLLCAFVMAGWLGYGSLVRESTPDLEIPQATVVVEWPGADPETIENQVAAELETELKAMEGLRKMQSASFDSFCVIAVEFEADEDIASAMARLRARVSAAEADLPSDVEKPRISEISVNNAPIISLSLYGEVDEIARGQALDALERRLENIKGVNEVSISGQRDEVVRVRLLPSRLAALGLSGSTVRSRLVDANRDQPWDRYEATTGSIVLVMRGRMRTLEALRQTPVARMGTGRVVRLSEVADIEFGLERERSRAFISTGGEPFASAVDVSVTRLSGADAIAVAQAVKAELEAARQGPSWPQGLQYRITSDQSVDIEDSLGDGFRNALQAMAAVFVVLLIALTWREAIVAGLAIPVTFLATLGVIWAFGYTLNDLIVIGMILALGLLVDVFILMMEGMHAAIYERGEGFATAAVSTIRTYAMPALAGQLTTIFALAPLMAIGGSDGKFIRFIPLTAIICLVLSYVVALLICVPISQLVLPNKPAARAPSRIDQITSRASDSLEKFISRVVVKSRVRAVLVAVGCMGMFLASVVAAGTLPSQLYPDTDGRNLGISIIMPADAGLELSQRCADQVGEQLRGKPYLESVTKFVGRASPFTRTRISSTLRPEEDTYIIGFSAKFTPEDDRDQISVAYLEPLRSELATALRACPGSLMTYSPQAQGGADSPIEVLVMGDDLDALRKTAGQVRQALAEIPGAVDIDDNLGQVRPTLEIAPDLEALDFFGISIGDFASQVRLGFAEDEAMKFPLGQGRDDLEVRVGTAWPSRKGKPGGPTDQWEAFALTVMSNEGRPVPLRELAMAKLVNAPLAITHYDGRRAVSVTARVSGVTAGEVLEQLQPRLDVLAKEHPGIAFAQAGEAESQAETFGSAFRMLGLAAFLVFAVLVIQFDSFRQPFAMMFVVPLSLTGTLVFFVVFREPISFPGLIGIISLIGIVVNNAIVMISSMNELRRDGHSIESAAAVGAAGRLRPILSTTLTTLVGMVPLALSNPQWFPLAGAIIGGLLAGTLFAMVATPAMFILVTSRR
ncbi:MAG: efflux RND transporter permease subunit [Myxococcota bacterium]